MKKKIFRIIRRSLIFLLALIMIGVGYGYYFLNKSLPTVEGKVNVSVLDENVKIYRNAKGIPTVEAKNEKDLYKAQGYVHAQDRLFQMDLARRQASGRLSEVVGKAALENDKKFLIFSLRRAAEDSYEGYSDEAKKILDYYAEGVNAYIDEAIKNNKLPYEFSLLGYKPEHWTPIDSLTIGKYMAYDLGGHWDHLGFNNWVLNNLGKENLKQLLPESFSKNKDNEDIINANLGLDVKIDKKLSEIPRPPMENGSNNWVVSGKKTKSGKPLLADDPHLGLSTPSVWYQMSLRTPEHKVSGVIFPGIPGIILGHNENIAWGVTNFGPDVQDLYIEKKDKNNPHRFEYDGEYYNAQVDKYKIKVKGENEEDFEVVRTKHGPIIDELLKPLGQNDKSFSMQWTALESTQELEAILKIDKAKNWEEFEKALEDFKAPAQNFVFADNNGNIAYKSNGNVPIRKKGDGNLPVPGYSSEYGWNGYVPYNELPKVVNPKEGFISTANTETIKTSYHTSNVWAQPYRKARIDEFLSEKNNLTVDDMKKLQMDTKNLYAVDFLSDLLKNVDENKISKKDVYETLKSWNYIDDKNEAAPLIYDTWMKKIRETILKDKMSEEVYKFMPHKESYVDKILRDAINGKKVNLIEEKGGLNTILQNSLNDTISELKNKYGENISSWKWGEEHKLGFRHPLSKSSDILAYFLNPKESPISGSKVTVQAAKQNEEGLVNHGASWRFVYDFENQTGHHIVGPGQSGHFMSPYYDNQVQDWIEGTYNSETITKIEAEKTLELVARK
ncbi:penicillin acylase family protein [Gemella cuniculi]|uniref:penicillin acylase family protein n=1 Tax=Gemella cuniculi TaxID=150240 RepID=UPI000422AA66|nr:penicillin acylase family protein [Gemella cuniculi]